MKMVAFKFYIKWYVHIVFLQGIYRVSGVKSTVENLCQRFELDPESVDLANENPNVISNVLKLYLRQLPEPLLTFKLYQNFVHVAKVYTYLTIISIIVVSVLLITCIMCNLPELWTSSSGYLLPLQLSHLNRIKEGP